MAEDLENDKLPKQELLIKILNQTTNDNDGIALNAIRSANAFLAKNKWDWEKLINGKIKIAANPFANLQTPQAQHMPHSRPAPPPPPPPPRPQPQPRPTAPPRPSTPPPPPKPKIDSTRTNMYAGHCYCCGDPVDVRAGWIFNPNQHNHRAPDKSLVVCHTCNQMPHPTVGTSAMPRKRQASGKIPNVNDLNF